MRRPYNDEYKENRSIASDDCDNRSRLTSKRDNSVSRFGSGSSAAAPSRDMFQNTTDPKKALMDKEATLAGEMVRATEVLKESSARRC
ncbi:hypothetical protein VKT23_020540 [Stygiomarasmius scandens]|uniref:Uncharacterized protein n=1 Tax=Marasmiellus scandens TaxID=2682957 RepID=A0ABR1IKN6_9AGAR